MATAIATQAIAASSIPKARTVNPWLIAITVTLATFMELLDTAIANVSLPHIAGGLATSYDESTWVLTSYLVARDPGTLGAIFRLWKPSMFAGFMGAFASQFWFLGFALTAVANVRTLALIEVLFAQAISLYSFKQKVSAREIAGIALIVVGVGLLVAVQ